MFLKCLVTAGRRAEGPLPSLLSTSCYPRRPFHHVLSASSDCWLEIFFFFFVTQGPQGILCICADCVVLLLSTVRDGRWISSAENVVMSGCILFFTVWRKEWLCLKMNWLSMAFLNYVKKYRVCWPQIIYYLLSKLFHILIYAIYIYPFSWPAKEDFFCEKC